MILLDIIVANIMIFALLVGIGLFLLELYFEKENDKII